MSFLKSFLFFFILLIVPLQAKLYIAISTSVPDAFWLETAKELEQRKISATFCLRGLPDQSFQKLRKKIQSLQERGFNANVEIHPEIFEDYAIDQVPVFLSIGKSAHDRVAGLLSLSYVLDLFKTQGEIEEDED